MHCTSSLLSVLLLLFSEPLLPCNAPTQPLLLLFLSQEHRHPIVLGTIHSHSKSSEDLITQTATGVITPYFADEAQRDRAVVQCPNHKIILFLSSNFFLVIHSFPEAFYSLSSAPQATINKKEDSKIIMDPTRRVLTIAALSSDSSCIPFIIPCLPIIHFDYKHLWSRAEPTGWFLRSSCYATFPSYRAGGFDCTKTIPPTVSYAMLKASEGCQ